MAEAPSVLKVVAARPPVAAMPWTRSPARGRGEVESPSARKATAEAPLA